MDIERKATQNARAWWRAATSERLNEELSRWAPDTKWVPTRNGWTGYHLIKSGLRGMRYSTKPIATGVEVRPEPEFVRL